MSERRSNSASASSSRSSSPAPMMMMMMMGPSASLHVSSNNLNHQYANFNNSSSSSNTNNYNNNGSLSLNVAASRTVAAAAAAAASSRSGSTGGRRSSPYRDNNQQQAFNPRLIFSQMVAIQCFHYVILGFLFQVNHILYNTSITIDRIFTDKYLHLYSLQSWADNAAILISSAMGAVLLAIIVEKSKKCLDFSVTLFLVHLLFCTLYNGIPATWDWWICHILGTIIMILLGEFLCSRRELDDIPLLQI